MAGAQVNRASLAGYGVDGGDTWCLRSHRSRPLIGSCSPNLNGYRGLIAPALRGKHGGGCGAVDGTKSSEIEKYIKKILFFSQYDYALGGRVPASDPGSEAGLPATHIAVLSRLLRGP